MTFTKHRLFWPAMILVILLVGPGRISLDYLLERHFGLQAR